jgi:hypothetical protein
VIGQIVLWLSLWLMVLFCVATFAEAVKENTKGRDGSFAVASAICAALVCVIAFGFTVMLS